ncbi:MAG: hypothetical protein PHI20_06575 [Endomicrobiaceae bacterium]|jgi:hypothetical protein|nr:hypothetical protein [Endomicrobiaceae bacterium]
MTRKNIFEKLADKINLKNEVDRIYDLLEKKLSIQEKSSWGMEKRTVIEIVNKYTFSTWKQRRRCLNIHDMMQELDIYRIDYDDSPDFEKNIAYIEFALNMIFLCDKAINDHYCLESYESYNMLRDNIDSVLDHLNMERRIYKDEEKVIIVEKNKAATAVAEIVNEKLSYKVIEYNHHLLKGDIIKKKDVLNALASELEPKRPILEKLDQTLSDNVFYMFNNINIRHNNKEKGKNHKEFVSKMSDKELEEWYDETYQLALLAILLLDNIARTKKIKDLKSKIEKK